MRAGLLTAAITAILLPGWASAQTESGTTELDRISVTGSRIRRVDVETAQPVLTLSREDIQAQGFSSIADVLQNISATGSPPFSRASPLTANQEAGGQYVDLRNLGAQRTLVLVNGKRLGISPAGYQDLSSVPTVMVERIEVLKDGASSIYGSDAMAGVINIITRKDFDGAELNFYGGEYSQGDGRKETADFMVGFSGDRGSITIGAEYHKEKDVWARDRWFSNDSFPYFPQFSTTVVGQWGNYNRNANRFRRDPATGNLIPNPTTGEPWWRAAAAYSAPNRGSNAIGSGNFHPQTGDDTSKSSDQMHLLTPLERRSLYVNANYDVSPNIRFVSDMSYTKRESFRQIAGYPLQSGGFGVPMAGAVYLTDNTGNRVFVRNGSYFNPNGNADLWDAEVAGLVDADGNPVVQSNDIDWRRRGWEVPRTTRTEQTAWRITAGLEGQFQIGERYFNWDVGGMFNQTDVTIINNGNFYIPAVANAVGPSFMNAQGQIVCGTPGNVIQGCVPWNPFAGFGTGAVEHSLDDPAVRNYLYREEHATGKTTTHNYFANLGGTLFRLPAGDLGFAVGYEYRKEEGAFAPDAIAQSGDSTNLASGPTLGAYTVNEVYAELSIPLLADLPGVKELTVDIASRYSDYDSFGQTTNNKVGFKWRPIDDLLVRATWAEGFRAPTIDDLYGGTSQTFTTNFVDPCDSVYGSVGGSARCLQDVPAGFRQLQQGFVPTAAAAAQTPVPFTGGSNPETQPETSTSKTIGLVYSPSFITGFSAGIDWWNIRIESTIRDDSPNQILRDCYVRLIDSRCTMFNRDPALGFIVTDLAYGVYNAGYLEADGFDISLNYHLDTGIGQWSVRSETTYTRKWEVKVTDEDDAVPNQINGFNDSFRIRSNLSLGWRLNNVAVNWGLRYFSGTKEPCYFDDICNLPDYASPSTGGQVDPMNKTGSVTFNDVQVAYSTPWNARISIGANNVFDKRLPVMYDGPSSNYSFYGGFDLGRFVYLRYNQKF